MSILLMKKTQVPIAPNSRVKWGLPGGGLDFQETKEHAAIRETEEEIGVLGELGGQIGTFTDRQSMTHTYCFPFRVTTELGDWKEKDVIMRKEKRDREWVSVEKVDMILASKPRNQAMFRLFVRSRPKLYKRLKKLKKQHSKRGHQQQAHQQQQWCEERRRGTSSKSHLFSIDLLDNDGSCK